jgi:hypothetical protein
MTMALDCGLKATFKVAFGLLVGWQRFIVADDLRWRDIRKEFGNSLASIE